MVESFTVKGMWNNSDAAKYAEANILSLEQYGFLE